MYRRFVTTTGRRSAKKLPKVVQEIFKVESRILEADPKKGSKLSGSLSFLYSFHFRHKGVDYRAAYTIDDDRKEVTIHLVDVRENFYQKLRRIFR